MHCRAYFLLERDFQELKENNFKGITAFPVSEDLMEWGANIEGLQNTFWHGLFFQLTIHFTSQYNFVPPVVKFITIPFHPNVDQNSGRVCIDFLDDPEKWNTNYTLSSILLALQSVREAAAYIGRVRANESSTGMPFRTFFREVELMALVMLSNPVLENPVNLEAARMLIKDESLYKQIVLRLFSQPIQFEIFADTQTEMDSVMKTGRTKERWKSVALPDGGNESESWEEEVEDLVTWTNTLNTNILED
ncbi:ubiquitin-conjugating enzyme E2 U isoform X22 [Canis lupus familiaris]|uniref:ubiquitin-conjugating enzyme E2 U isoform X22 n=1 Tax=Canis lupus familiaris TaxID=9615 RepID=UPI0018F64A2A|nr:ubiquitin-conjugating enzyme E2 U isoform X22 [Canis lupus familiaris]XP_038521889.1 ubiquitin-conjugating enzyme E2 U isoform X22 [Canis lupus familiaris]